MIPGKYIDGILWVTAADHQADLLRLADVIAALTADAESHRKSAETWKRRYDAKCEEFKLILRQITLERDALQAKLDAFRDCTVETCSAALQEHDKRIRDEAIEEMAKLLEGAGKYSAAALLHIHAANSEVTAD